ncbi:MAG: hypothetical protein KA275_04430, partial [Chitinophagaceae bacterium]|nr:hypothetical protein [Chitinophagaceae bacterium]
MDVVNYIGPFLLKNKYCSMASLGTFNLQKKSAQLQDGTLSAPKYVLTYQQVGSIDDSFATYIANIENVSIAKASNEISFFGKAVKDDLKRGMKVDLNNLGSLTMQNDQISFQQSPDLNLEFQDLELPVPHFENLAKNETEIPNTFFTEQNKVDYVAPEQQISKVRSKSAMLKYILVTLGLLALGVIGFFGFQYYQQNKATLLPNNESVKEEVVVADVDSSFNNNEALENDSLTKPTTDTSVVNPTTPKAATAPLAPGEYRIAVKSYVDKAAADKKSTQLNSFNNKTEVVTNGNEFLLVVRATSASGDT